MTWSVDTRPAGNEFTAVRDPLTETVTIVHGRLHVGAVNPLHYIDEMPPQCHIEESKRQVGYHDIVLR